MHSMRRRHLPAMTGMGINPSVDSLSSSSLNGHRGRVGHDPSVMAGGGRVDSSNMRRLQHSAMEAVDASSCKGIFGWACIDNVNIPYILRGRTKYVSVRMVEMKLLSKYPSTYPDELKDRAPLTSQFITVNEAKLLNEINSQHCAFEYGQQGFDGQDLIVILADFEEFYGIVKRNFPQDTMVDAGATPQEKSSKPSAATSASSVDGGWIQVNNTIVPFLIRKGIKLVPLPVIRYGANLLNNVQVAGLECSEKELAYLNQNCQEIGLDFTFSKASTKLIEISLIPTLSETRTSITELPKEDPFGHALYKSEEEIGQPAPNYPSAMQSFPRAGSSGYGPNKGALPSQIPSTLSPQMGPGQLPENLSCGSLSGVTTLSIPNDAPNTPWMGPNMGLFPGGTQRAPPPPYSQGQTCSASHSITSPRIAGAISRVIQPPALESGPAYLPHQQSLPPNSVSKPSTSSADVLDLSAKSSPHAAIGSPPSVSNSGSTWQAQETVPKAVASTGSSNKRVSRRKLVPQYQTHGNIPANASIIKLKDGRSIELRSTNFHGKGITCIVKDGDGYALLESLNRMFFPKCSLEDFTRDLSDVFKLKIKELTKEEEQAFIAHYELRIRNLRCTKVVSLGDMDLNMTRMKFVFNNEDSDMTVLPLKVTQAEPESQDTNNNNGAAAAAADIVVQDPEAQANHRAACQALKNFIGKRVASTEGDTASPPLKRMTTSGSISHPAKHATGKLENIMNKLKKAQQKPGGILDSSLAGNDVGNEDCIEETHQEDQQDAELKKKIDISIDDLASNDRSENGYKASEVEYNVNEEKDKIESEKSDSNEKEGDFQIQTEHQEHDKDNGRSGKCAKMSCAEESLSNKTEAESNGMKVSEVYGDIKANLPEEDKKDGATKNNETPQQPEMENEDETKEGISTGNSQQPKKRALELDENTSEKYADICEEETKVNETHKKENVTEHANSLPTGEPVLTASEATNAKENNIAEWKGDDNNYGGKTNELVIDAATSAKDDTDIEDDVVHGDEFDLDGITSLHILPRDNSHNKPFQDIGESQQDVAYDGAALGTFSAVLGKDIQMDGNEDKKDDSGLSGMLMKPKDVHEKLNEISDKVYDIMQKENEKDNPE